ncbi:MAG: ABC transporter ATP-binding protein [Bryobacterales bacterium]|nr:ABC transporter ATP-binding protein [Bryobacterales bacterium]
MPSDLVVRALRKEYPHPSGTLVVLDGLSLAMSRGEALAVMGPSGSGKSTLLYILGSLESPTAGAVEICGQDPFALGPAGLARFRNRSVGFVFQDHHLLPQCTSLENVLVPTLARGGASPEDAVRAKDLLGRVGLAERMDRLPSELSGGERQRVAIARALINSPPVVLADEPTGNLDRRSARRVGSLLLELQRERDILLIAVTHSVDLAARFPERAELVDGRLERGA